MIPCGIDWCIALARESGKYCRLHAERPDLHPRETQYVVELRSGHSLPDDDPRARVLPRLGGMNSMAVPTIVAGLFEFDGVLCAECGNSGDCETCGGSGEHECDCGHEHDCVHCDGDGKCPECKERRREAGEIDDDDLVYLLWAQTPAYVPPEPIEVFWPE